MNMRARLAGTPASRLLSGWLPALLLVILLITLAWLQYNWIGQVTLAEREQLRVGLEENLAALKTDMNRELAAVLTAFSPEIPPSEAASLEGLLVWGSEFLAGRLERWTQDARYPALVNTVFLLDGLGESEPRLYSVEKINARLIPADWPGSLAELRPILKNYGRETGLEREAEGWQRAVHGDLPPLMVPLAFSTQNEVEVTVDASIPGRRRPRRARPLLCAVIELNRDCLSREILPDLVFKYLARENQLVYDVAVLNTFDKRIIYQAQPGVTAMMGDAADGRAELLAFSVERFPLERVPAGVSAVVANTELQARPVPGGGPDPAGALNQMIWGARPRWTLVARHRSGSLDQFVTTLRHRNLLISVGILSLLGFSMALMVVASRRAQRLARQQVEFVAGVSHELRTPVTVICSAAENLADGVIEERDKVRDYGALIRNEGRRLAEMVEQTLDYAGIQAGRWRYQLRTVDITALLEDALCKCARSIGERGFQVEYAISPVPAIRADFDALSRAFQNLISNALKFSADDRRLQVKATAVNGYVEVIVRDYGIGIVAEDLPHVFEPFFQGRAARSAGLRGNGVGLSIVRHVISSHGGTVTLSGHPEGGTVATVRLPVAPCEAEDQQ